MGKDSPGASGQAGAVAHKSPQDFKLPQRTRCLSGLTGRMKHLTRGRETASQPDGCGRKPERKQGLMQTGTEGLTDSSGVVHSPPPQ